MPLKVKLIVSTHGRITIPAVIRKLLNIDVKKSYVMEVIILSVKEREVVKDGANKRNSGDK